MMRTVTTWLIILAGFGLASLWLSNATKPTGRSTRRQGPGSEFHIVAPLFREFDGGGLRMSAKSTEATFDQSASLVEGHGISGYVLRDGHRTELWADKGFYQVDTSMATLTENVRLENDQGYTFRTNEAHYRHDLRTLTTAGPFVAEGKSMRLNGVGLLYNLEADTFRIEHSVDAKIERFTF